MTVYDVITKRIVELLEQGTIPWRKPWAGGGEPRNLTSGKAYRGINVFMLAASGYSSPYWLTFKQALAAGGCVRKGEHGTPVIFWKRAEEAETEEEEGGKYRGPVCRYYSVFNVAQCDGIQAPTPEPLNFEPIPECVRIVSDWKQAPLIHHRGNRACYSPISDEVEMPSPGSFISPEAYYSTLFHELTHSTGHGSRLARKGVTEPTGYGTHEYSREELVAEMGAAFLCGATGIELASTLENSSAYLASWIKALKGDARLVVTAGAQAQRAADHILGRFAEKAAEEGGESSGAIAA
jgi:antirestriction protein ArdC